MGRVLALAVALVAAVACAAPPPPVPPGLVFPRHTLGVGDAMPEALLEGVVREERGCLWLEAETGDVVARTLALWRRDWHPIALDDGRIGIVDERGRVVLVEDERAVVSGGYAQVPSPALDRGTVEAATSCSGGPWWLVAGVASAP